MTLIHLYRKYKAWNPVHATAGAFWGFGVGLGCGVGWGPGFGPEVIGYVGSGCGLGFSIGVTFMGFGIGLPAAGMACLPLDTIQYTARQSASLSKRGGALRAAIRAWDRAHEGALSLSRSAEFRNVALRLTQGLEVAKVQVLNLKLQDKFADGVVAVRQQVAGLQLGARLAEGTRGLRVSVAVPFQELLRVPSYISTSSTDLINAWRQLPPSQEKLALALKLLSEEFGRLMQLGLVQR